MWLQHANHSPMTASWLSLCIRSIQDDRETSPIIPPCFSGHIVVSSSPLQVTNPFVSPSSDLPSPSFPPSHPLLICTVFWVVTDYVHTSHCDRCEWLVSDNYIGRCIDYPITSRRLPSLLPSPIPFVALQTSEGRNSSWEARDSYDARMIVKGRLMDWMGEVISPLLSRVMMITLCDQKKSTVEWSACAPPNGLSLSLAKTYPGHKRWTTVGHTVVARLHRPTAV